MKTKATTTWSAADEIAVAKAFGAARDKLRAQIGREPIGPEIILGVFEFLAEINSRTPKDDGPREDANSWPDYLHDLDEKNEALKQRRIDEAAGVDMAVLLGFRPKPTEEEIDAATSINTVFSKSLVGEEQERDWKILRHAARKMTDKQIAAKLNRDAFKNALKRLSPRQRREAIARLKADESLVDIARSYGIAHITRQGVDKRKQKQLDAIWQAVQHLMPAPTKSKRTAPKKTGVIWRNAA